MLRKTRPEALVLRRSKGSKTAPIDLDPLLQATTKSKEARATVRLMLVGRRL